MKTRLTQTVSRQPAEAAGKWAIMRLVRWIDLPFVPSPGTRLGLLLWSDFHESDERVGDVLYNVPQHLLLVELESGSAFPAHEEEEFWATLQAYVEEGWRLDLETMVSGADREEAQDYALDGDVIIQLGDRFYPVDEDDLRLLRIQGTEYRLVQHQESDP
jgi:hypothetical protein